jgi:predicted amidophosphoribosyltransferase
MLTLKLGRLAGAPPISMGARIASFIQQHMVSVGTFVPFLSSAQVLVPVPKSALHREGSLWVPDQLANAMVDAGLGARVAQLLQRSEAIPKAATSRPSERPTALRHYQTLATQTDLAPVPGFLLVDDIVTTGAALLGSANRLMDSYPGVPVRGFAAIRTISNPDEFERITSPTTGSIVLQENGWCIRRP